MNQERAAELWSKRQIQNQIVGMTKEEDQFITTIWRSMPTSACWMDAFFRVLNPWVVVNVTTGKAVLQFQARDLAEAVVQTVHAGQARSLGSTLVVDGESYAVKYRHPDGTLSEGEP